MNEQIKLRRKFRGRRQSVRPPRSAAGDRATGDSNASREAPRGFSVVEVMIASTILLVVTIGVLPLFTRSISNNAQGQLSSEVVNEARSEVERLMQVGFNDPDLTVPPGSNELLVEEYWDENDYEWKTGSKTGNYTTRRVRVRQFPQSALDDEKLEDSEALDGGVASSFVHLKEIEVRVAIAGRGDAPAKRLTLRVFRGA